MRNCVTGLAISNNKKNKTRSILIIIAILLSTMLVTVIGTFSYGSVKHNIQSAKERYGSYFGTYANITESQIHEMKLRSEFSDMGFMSYAGKVNSHKDSKLYWADDTVLSLTNQDKQLLRGTFPKHENEIVAQKAFFESLGYENPEIGDQVKFSARRDNNSKFKDQTFTISGILKEHPGKIEQSGYNAYISKSYYENQFLEENRYYSVYFGLNKSVPITSDNAEEFIIGLAKKCGISERQVYVNTYYLIWALDPGTDIIIGALIIIACILVFTIIVIYNIFQIGIAQKIQEYGKIKAIGATRKQLGNVVMREGMLLAFIGIPIGLILGCILSKISFEWIMNQSEAIQPGIKTADISIISVPLLLGIIVILLITVWIALRKPIKIVSKISPIEAIRYQDIDFPKKHVRKGYGSMGVREMTLASLSANKKRTIMTICTMGLSCVLFVVIANFVGNIDNEYNARQSVEYGQFVISLNYSLNDKAYPENNLDAILKNNPLDRNVVEQIKKIDGITDIKTRNILAMEVGNQLNSVLVLNKEGFEYFTEGGSGKGNLDYDTAVKNNAIIFGWSNFIEYEGYSLGQTMNAILFGGKKEADYTGTIQGAFGNCNADWAITDETSRKLGLDGNIGYIWVNCDKENIAAVKENLEKIFADNKYIGMETYQNALSISKASSRFMELACYTILSIIGVIGFMNMANTMIISIITRKREFGVLQAIGMTNRQLNLMLQVEGIIFTLGTILMAVMVGVPTGYMLFQYGRSHGWFGLYIYHFPWIEILVMIMILLALQIILSFLLSRNVRKESLVERIRYEE